ncbi:MAG: thioredoxin domain-containing protein [Verrucomicrobiae bacterium]|nr:thioredoxin domain-containing protein [Verrucomicrobiae bacterium]
MPNALLHETSPYLLQHAHNPVEWLPWGDAAFERARAENKMIFLSVGYSTCHWCHVMERESFENDDVASVMNHHFINVKVDREERPDVDSAYMAFVQATTGQGGWPMSVWITPEGKPVFGGTYFPPGDRYGRPGFVRVLHELARVWRDDRRRLEESADKVVDHLRREPPAAETRDEAVEPHLDAYLDVCASAHDQELGGFGGAPKFPRPVVLTTLMRLSDRWGRDAGKGVKAWDMCDSTLRAMAAGGIHDQLGGGFHRYSVDRYWHVPHYEKMLYDQAQLADAYLDAWQISGEPVFRSVIEGTLRYLLDEMKDSGGAFHAAEDADSLLHPDAKEKHEGAFWTWTEEEIRRHLATEDADLFIATYGVEPDGNARPESDPHGELTGRNTLYQAMTSGELAARFDRTEVEVARSLEGSRATLYQIRARRPPPHRDDKIVTAWNGLAIGALARCGRALDRPEWIAAAEIAAGFLRRGLWDGGRLFRSFRGHRGDAPGFPADHAFLISGLIELHAARPDDGWLVWALEIQRDLDERYWDETRRSFSVTHHVGGTQLWTLRDDHDGAEPAANHVSAINLLRLATLTGDDGFAGRAGAILDGAAELLRENPFSVPVLAAAADLRDRGVTKIEVPENVEAATMEKLRTRYMPHAVLTRGAGDEVVVCSGMSCRIFA